MKHWAGLMLAVLMTACAMSTPNPGLTERRAVVVDGKSYEVGRLTESTWTAIGRPDAGSTALLSAEHRAALIVEIERLSKCRVTDSDYAQEARQLDAQVDCNRRLQN
jgi:hypothetical protein